MGVGPSGRVDRLLWVVHRWIWDDPDRRVRKLLSFAEVETDGGRDLLRAAEVTADPLLRRLYLAHAIDELHHGDLLRQRGAALLRTRTQRTALAAPSRWLPSDGHGIDDLRIGDEPDESLLAFLHLAEKSAAGRFSIYREVVGDDTLTRAVFEEILHDEVFHMNYTYTQLARIAPGSYRRRLWRARAGRLWKQYLRLSSAFAGVIGTIMLTVVYFILLPPFAWLAKRAERREKAGWALHPSEPNESLTGQY
jgi:bacterioferritin (cytochrome b1)